MEINWIRSDFVLKFKFHPTYKKIAYASLSDLGGYVTEDGGESYRIISSGYNTNYDYAFDSKMPSRVYMASGNAHDFPLNLNTPIHGEGGIFMSDDLGKKFIRLTPNIDSYNRQFLSIAFDSVNRILYGGTEGGGVTRSKDNGKTWNYINLGFPSGDLVIPELVIDEKDGTLYALLTGNAPEYKNKDETGIYVLKRGEDQFKPLSNTKNKSWYFPSFFAIDFSNPDRKVIWLTDIENVNARGESGVFKTMDQGHTWIRKIQFTHPTSITLVNQHDNKNKKNNLLEETVLISGLDDLSRSWGEGGSLSSKDGGATWRKNKSLPLGANLFGVTPDPNDFKSGFFLFFGGGILHGPLQSLNVPIAPQ